MGQYSVGIDVGGTFTDLVLFDEKDQRLRELKVPTTKGQTTRGLIEGVGKLAMSAGARPSAIDAIAHGTTMGTNALLERKGNGVALIVTAGCRYVMEIGRHDVPKDVNMFVWRKPDKLVRPRDIFEVEERLDASGNVVVPLDRASVAAAVSEIRRRGILSIAVSLLHAYVNPVHEAAVSGIVRELYAEATVTCSSEVMPVFREYERTMATVINAYLLPLFGDYEFHLEKGLTRIGIRAPVRIMQSNGGLYSLKSAARRPVTTILSGPAAGVIGARFVGQLIGRDRLISLDIGGTSADIALIDGKDLSIRSECELGGLPVAVPMIDMKTIGAGGGSLARVSLAGNLIVGPESAGSEPGPACYGRGGVEATVTDAHLVLGHLGESLLEGAMPMFRDRAVEAVARSVAAPLKLPVEAAAAGILSVVNENMAGALREVSVEKGYDPRDYTLVAFGGAGPLHASMFCRMLGMRNFVAPAHAGVLSAVGLLATDIRSDFARTAIMRTSTPDPRVLGEIYRELEDKARRWLSEELGDSREGHVLRQADLRYRHQGYEVPVPVPDGVLTEAAVLAVREAFDREHRRLYGYSLPGGPVDWVTLRATAVGRLPKVTPDVLHVSSDGRAKANRPERTRDVYQLESRRFVPVPVVNGPDLTPGAAVRGPAIIEMPSSTVLLLDGDKAGRDEYGNVLVEVAA